MRSKEDALSCIHLSAMWKIDNLNLGNLKSKYEHVGAIGTLQIVSAMTITCVCYFVKLQNSCKHKKYPVFLNPNNLFS